MKMTTCRNVNEIHWEYRHPCSHSSILEAHTGFCSLTQNKVHNEEHRSEHYSRHYNGQYCLPTHIKRFNLGIYDYTYSVVTCTSYYC